MLTNLEFHSRFINTQIKIENTKTCFSRERWTNWINDSMTHSNVSSQIDDLQNGLLNESVNNSKQSFQWMASKVTEMNQKPHHYRTLLIQIYWYPFLMNFYPMVLICVWWVGTVESFQRLVPQLNHSSSLLKLRGLRCMYWAGLCQRRGFSTMTCCWSSALYYITHGLLHRLFRKDSQYCHGNGPGDNRWWERVLSGS